MMFKHLLTVGVMCLGLTIGVVGNVSAQQYARTEDGQLAVYLCTVYNCQWYLLDRLCLDAARTPLESRIFFYAYGSAGLEACQRVGLGGTIQQMSNEHQQLADDTIEQALRNATGQ